jgi:catechol 2,3-dioxygenase-like lactoylglutathione lyase family enzyme
MKNVKCKMGWMGQTRFFQTRWQPLVILHFTFFILHSSSAQNRDNQAAKSRAEDALTRPLFGATICTNSLAETRLFYEQGLGMRLRGPLPLSAKQKATERALYQIPARLDWQTYLLDRPGTEGMVLRVMLLNRPVPAIHQSWNSLELGPFSLGFPNTRQAQLDSLVRKLGFGAQAPMNVYPVPAADGSRYTISETIFNGPDFVKSVGVMRGDGMNQLSPTGPDGLGGPGYSAQVVADADAMLRFYVDVLGLEVRSDRVWTTSGALGVPAGTQYRFLTVYAKGASWGHILFIQYTNQLPIDPAAGPTGVAPRLPNRGIGAWTFRCRDVPEVYRRLQAGGYVIVQKPTLVNSVYFGTKLAMTALAPNGFLVELIQDDK